jgi:hypothetical protein
MAAVSIIRIEDPKIFVGMEIERARTEITSHGYDVRVIQAQTPYKPDYDPLRVLLFTQNDKIVDAKIG